jgi:hypothetical protein
MTRKINNEKYKRKKENHKCCHCGWAALTYSSAKDKAQC